MKIITSCAVCMQNQYKFTPDISTTVLNDSGIYDVVCRKGHVSKTILQNHKYEILFEIGVNAIADDYYREAIVSFTSCLEEFRKLVIYALLIKQGMTWDAVDKCWAQVRKQSERQLGMFIATYTMALKNSPTIFNEKNVTLRNNVVHNGYIPTEMEAIKFGEDIRTYIYNCQEEITAQYPEIWDEMIMHYVIRLNAQLSDDTPRSTAFHPTIISQNDEKKDLTEMIREMRKHNSPTIREKIIDKVLTLVSNGTVGVSGWDDAPDTSTEK